MSGSALQSRTCTNVKHPSSGRGEAVPLISKLKYQSNNILEPTPFREGASLELLPHSNNIFVPIVGLQSKKLESYVSPDIACIRGSQLPETDVEYEPFSWASISVNTKLTLLPSLPVTIRDTMSLAAFPPEKMSTSAQSPKKHTQKLQNAQDAHWEERFQQLLTFKANHGHCLVPHAYPKNPSFARWAKRQRFQYKLLRNHKPSVMTEEKIHRLESVGFVWEPQTAAWEARLMELREFKMIHGHCNVPCRYRQNPALGAWVKRQRSMYKKYMSGAPTNVPEDRFRILSDMGFHRERIGIGASSDMGS